MVKFDEYGVDRSGNWLQLFAVNVPDDEDDLDEDTPESEDDDSEPEDDDTPEPEDDDEGSEDDDEGSEDDDGNTAKGQKANTGKDQKTFTEEQVNRIVQRRLERERSKLKQSTSNEDYIETLFEKAKVPSMDMGEVTEALRLWTYLKHNQDISREVDKVINSKPGTMPAYIGPAKKAGKASDGDVDRIGLIETKLDLRTTDPTYKKYESRILDWADQEGIEIKDARSLKLAFKAWKGEHARLLLANAEKRGEDKARKNRQAAERGRGVPRKGSGKRGKVDYTKMSADDILAEEGLSLFDED